MRTFTALVAASLAAGCGKNQGDKDGTQDSGATQVPPITFADRVNATALEAEVSVDTEHAQRAANVLLGAVGLSFADASVRAKMTELADTARDSHCWTGPLFPLSQFTLDYTPCSAVEIAGGMVFNLDPLGPASMDFKDVTFGTTRSVDGAMGFDPTGAELQRWTVYDTVADQPIPGNRAPFAIEVEGRRSSATFDGGAFMRGLNQNVALWGVLNLTPDGGTATKVLVGGTNEALLTTSSEPAEPASLPFAYLTCRCPTAGVMSLDVGLDIAEVTFDLDDLEVTPDAVDDPEVSIDAVATAVGPTDVRTIACGEYETTWNGTESVDVVVTSDQIRAAVSDLCAAAVITDPGRCAALERAADGVAEVVVKVNANRLGDAAANEVASGFDTAYCRP